MESGKKLYGKDIFAPRNLPIIFSTMNNTAERFEEIFYATKDRLYWFSKKILKDDFLVQDCMQQCYMKFWENIEKLDTRYDVLPLLFTYARNICIDHLRRNARYVWMESLEPFAEQADQESNIESYIKAENTRFELQSMIGKLSPRRREVCTLIKLHGYSYKEVSEQLNISISTVEKHMHSASRSLSDDAVMKMIAGLVVAGLSGHPFIH
jgi:RNA polymerase sigma-70 factor (ECF subfamily)